MNLRLLSSCNTCVKGRCCGWTELQALYRYLAVNDIPDSFTRTAVGFLSHRSPDALNGYQCGRNWTNLRKVWENLEKRERNYEWRIFLYVALAQSLPIPTFLTLLMAFFNFFGKISEVLKLWPGKNYFGPYRFLPLFFLSGAGLEFCMIHWKPNGVNFYDTFKTKQAKKLALQKWEKWKQIEASYK